tara:strand:+ start:7870 stop:8061 length:192 start_codon:yes stop_codon:yes gene_type:complete
MDIDRKEQEIELLNYMAKDLMVCEERCAGGAARVLNALLALYDVCEEKGPNVFELPRLSQRES